MFDKYCRWGCALSLALLVGGVGCQGQVNEATQTSSEEQAESFRESVAGIEAMATKICKAFADGTPDDAHDALHEVGHSLEKLPVLAAKDGKLTEEQMTVVNEAVEALFDGFGKLDDTLHGGDEVDIAAIEGTLTETLAKLNEVSK
jgi:hypothetical protein